jgi:hypothetical protein
VRLCLRVIPRGRGDRWTVAATLDDDGQRIPLGVSGAVGAAKRDTILAGWRAFARELRGDVVVERGALRHASPTGASAAAAQGAPRPVALPARARA